MSKETFEEYYEEYLKESHEYGCFEQDDFMHLWTHQQSKLDQKNAILSEQENRIKELEEENKLIDKLEKAWDSVCKEKRKFKQQIKEAIDKIVAYGDYDGAHHKDWVLDQVVRILAADGYDKVVKDACDGKEGPNTYSWDCGTAP